MASKTAVCGICDLRQITKPSDVWCSECDEGLCLECKEQHALSKGTHNHNTIPISMYGNMPSNGLDLSQFCSDHKKTFQFYCKKHDHPCCSRCVVLEHQKCQDLIEINDMIQNVKKSCGFHEIEQAMIAMIENIQKIKKDRQANLSTLKKERKMIENEIEHTRIKLNAQLDKFQEATIEELNEAESKESKMIGELLDSIEKKEKEISEYQANLINIKQHASDLQTFLAMKQIERDVAKNDEYFTSLVSSNKLNRVSLSCKMNDAFQSSLNEIRKLGEIIVSTHSSEVEIVRKKETEAQIAIAHLRSMSIENLSFALQLAIDTKLDDIRGCTLLPDGRMVFSCYVKQCVRGFNSDGSQDFDIMLNTRPFDIIYIYENNTIAATGGDDYPCIRIIDLNSKKLKKTIPVKSKNHGIVRRNNTFIYCAGDRGLRMLNLTDKSVHNIVTSPMSQDAYVTIFGDKLYYTNRIYNTVTCRDLHGIVQWKFKDESVLKWPQGISVDNSGNVFVIQEFSKNVLVISADGQRHRQVLPQENGLFSPQALHYDRSTNQILVANRSGKAFLYKMESHLI